MHLFGDFTSEDARRRMEQAARDGGYHVEDWLVPTADNTAMKVTATMKAGGKLRGLGFRWDGKDFNDLLSRCMALDLSMRQIPQAVQKNRDFAIWEGLN